MMRRRGKAMHDLVLAPVVGVCAVVVVRVEDKAGPTGIGPVQFVCRRWLVWCAGVARAAGSRGLVQSDLC